MRVYVITYDLNRPGQGYEALFAAIKSYGYYGHYQDSGWVIATSRSAAQVRDHLLQHLDRNDSLLVARLQGEAAWHGISGEVSQWLKDQLNAAA